LVRNSEFRWLLLVLMAAVFTHEVAAAKNVTFQGLSGVRIKVEVDPSLREDGFSAEKVTSHVQARLQEKKIPVLSEEQWQTVDHHPLLYLEIHGSQVQENWKFYTFAVNVFLLQDVTLVREAGTIRHQAATWFTGLAGHGYFGDIQTRINELVERFTTLYRQANSR